MFALLLSGVFVVAVSVILVFVVVIVLVVASSGFALVVAFDCWDWCCCAAGLVTLLLASFDAVDCSTSSSNTFCAATSTTTMPVSVNNARIVIAFNPCTYLKYFIQFQCFDFPKYARCNHVKSQFECIKLKR